MSTKANTGTKNKANDKSARSGTPPVNDDSRAFLEALEEATDPVAEVEMRADVLESEFYRSAVAPDSPLQMGPLSDVLGKAQRAYSAYLEAQKEVAKAYKVNELQLERAYREAERHADEECQNTIAELLADREESEQQAEETFRNAVEQARQMEKDAQEAYSQTLDQVRENCEANVNEALKTRDAANAKAWELRSRTVDRAWAIFLKETGTE